MKRILSVAALTAVMLVTMAGNAHAASWRVNNNAAKGAHFTSINAAVASSEVLRGDTLYLDPNCSLEATQTVTKQLTIIGTGYFLSGLPYTAATISGELILKAKNCKVEGLELAGVSIEADNVTVERCKTANISFVNSGTIPYARNAVIRQCYVNGKIKGSGATSEKSANCTIENCIVISTSTNSDATIEYLYSATIRNNYLKRTQRYTSNSYDGCIRDCQNGSVTNNILYNTKAPALVLYSTTNTAVSNNIMSSESNSSYPNNTFCGVASEASTFALTGNNDERYQLKDDSPAKGYAADGGDCGPFGGLFPYVLSGHPVGIPYFESMNTPTRSTNGQVKITQHVKLQTK